jgi:hypothetical protein
VDADTSRATEAVVCTSWHAMDPNNGKWEYNHFSEGYSPSVRSPTPNCELQKAAWRKKPWAAFRAELVNGVLLECPERINAGPINWTGSNA